MVIIRAKLLIGIISLSLLGCVPSRPSGPVHAPVMVETDQGSIREARFKLAKPRDWNGRIFLLAPGWRPPDAKRMAFLDIHGALESELLRAGWLIATTSYRRNGLVVEDGVQDLKKLVQRIEKLYGPAERLVIEGSSMGGAIGVLIAEGSFFPALLQVGVLAYGVDLEEPGETGPLPLTHRPGHPLLLMSNRSEWVSPMNYVRQSPWGPLRPALWSLDRDGHVNLNSAERSRALEAMNHWLSTGERPAGKPPSGLDVTVDFSLRSATAVRTPNGLRVRVTGIDPIFGNVETDMVAESFEWLSWYFAGEIGVRGGTLQPILFGTTYGDVDPGELVAFVTAEGYVRVAQNMGNAAQRLKCQVGDYLDFEERVPAEMPGISVPRCPPNNKTDGKPKPVFDGNG